MMSYLIRAETRDGYFDAVVGDGTLAGARDLFETGRPQLRPFDWRGAVVFCQGAKPAEEIGATRDDLTGQVALAGRR